VAGACGRYLVLDGVVTRSGRPFLRRGALAAAFPGGAAGRVEAFRVADAQDGKLAVAVLDAAGRGAVELWRGPTVFAAFRVPARSFAAGLGWTPRGDLVATYPRRGRPSLYNERGVRVGEARWERRPG
jgi:catechol 2,3-dioxygenase-like lactoylglutathione lyase family enzyme